MLDVDESHLVYHLYILKPRQKYQTFNIPKKSGGQRQITAPISAIKIIQRKLNQVLQSVYQPKAAVHGFVAERSIVSNASLHSQKGKRLILNLDLRDFFPSINFGRVRGMFMAVPYSLNAKVATILAQICCFENQLPQGAPTSPVVSNMICAKMDSQLTRLAGSSKCTYTRYADDITFSTTLRSFTTSIVNTDEVSGQIGLGDELKNIIASNGFAVNSTKLRLQSKATRQEVTGITVNEFPNVNRRFVRQVRSMLRAWRRFGFDAAEQEYRQKYDEKHRNRKRQPVSFKRVVQGKIAFLGMVRGRDDSIYLNFLTQLYLLEPSLVKNAGESITSAPDQPVQATLFTEGKTDWKHLKAAFDAVGQTRYPGLQLDFREQQTSKGKDALLEMCKYYAESHHGAAVIFVFDRDDVRIIREVTGTTQPFRHWANDVYSLAIPVPAHREENSKVCIELYYTDAEIKQPDVQGRRMYLSNEFDETTRALLTNPAIYCLDKRVQDRSRISVIADEVFENGKNIALPKETSLQTTC